MSLRTCQAALSVLRRSTRRSAGAVTTAASSPPPAPWWCPPSRSDDDDARGAAVRFLTTDAGGAGSGSDGGGGLPEKTKPTADIARMMPVGMSMVDNATLVTIASLGDHSARREVLVRHVMTVDGVDYDEADGTVAEMEDANRANLTAYKYPYLISIGLGIFGAFASLPMVFDLSTAKWFNEFYVTTDLPEPRDLETMLEVGSWSWGWMEPPLGALSFSLLCLQYSRAQWQNLGMAPYTQNLIHRRADTLADAYPRYDRDVVRQFSESAPLFQQ